MGTFSNNADRGRYLPGGLKGRKGGIEIEGVAELNRRFNELARKVVTKQERQRILVAGSVPIIRASKQIAKKADRDYDFYSTTGKKYTIKQGNLRKSIRAFRRRDGDVAIGPKRLRKLSGSTIGDNIKNASGFYAAMYYKSASRYRTEVTEKATQQAITKAFMAMDKAVERILKKYD